MEQLNLQLLRNRPFLTANRAESAGKNAECARARNKTRINIGLAFQRWWEL